MLFRPLPCNRNDVEFKRNLREIIKRLLMIFTVMVPRRPEQQVSACLRRAGQEGEMLRQHQDHEERPRFAILRGEP